MFDGSVGHSPKLVAPSFVTGVEAGRRTAPPPERVHAEGALSQTAPSSTSAGRGGFQFRVDMAQVPRKWLAMESLSQCHSLINATGKETNILVLKHHIH